MNFDLTLQQLQSEGNFRTLPVDTTPGTVDLSGNDYLGLGADVSLREKFFSIRPVSSLAMTSAASRLLAGNQAVYSDFENLLAKSYGHGRAALTFNSGYHANTGLVSSLADKSTLIVADRLVHASIIDGIRLSGADFVRFPHNDFTRLEEIMKGRAQKYPRVLIIAESVYSMDGDRSDIPALVAAKKHHPDAMLYIDEAHAVGVLGPGGLGLVAAERLVSEVDILVGTLGKALASMGAFSITTPAVRDFLINKARSFIFSTALPPAQLQWSTFMWLTALEADSHRSSLAALSRTLADIIPGGAPSHIRPFIVGTAKGAVELSLLLADNGFKVLPIRTPTVPPGTERLRFSLSADIKPESLSPLKKLLADAIQTGK
ncbi:MAG: aminotransferase class I/II-fold pyridoxal phosphate-dependent enzyme [Muribaculaceae bacterium]|nr:aminotransferase class I/II-fold pyridoxal phosphate-dependent enzyme [Muribaculaceae bacterium]